MLCHAKRRADDRGSGDESGEPPAPMNHIGSRSMRLAKPSSQSRIRHHETGQSMMLANSTGRENCQTNRRTMSPAFGAKYLANADFAGCDGLR